MVVVLVQSFVAMPGVEIGAGAGGGADDDYGIASVSDATRPQTPLIPLVTAALRQTTWLERVAKVPGDGLRYDHARRQPTYSYCLAQCSPSSSLSEDLDRNQIYSQPLGSALQCSACASWTARRRYPGSRDHGD